jgi:cell division septum initiation protein DivIVA
MSQTVDRILGEMDELCKSSSKVLGRRGKVMVDPEKLSHIVAELRASLPEHMLEAGEVIKQKDSIINQAYLESKRLRESASQESKAIAIAARSEHETMVSDSEIARAAEEQAQKIHDEAHRKAGEILREAGQEAVRLIGEADATAAGRREGADQYSREVLFSIEERLSQMLGQVRRGIDALGTDVDPMAKKMGQPAINGRSIE